LKATWSRTGFWSLSLKISLSMASFGKARREIAVVKPVNGDIDHKQRLVRERLAQGDRTVVDASAEVRNKLSTSLNILYIKAKRGY
jgi:hypothetical protein